MTQQPQPEFVTLPNQLFQALFATATQMSAQTQTPAGVPLWKLLAEVTENIRGAEAPEEPTLDVDEMIANGEAKLETPVKEEKVKQNKLPKDTVSQ